MMMGTTDKNATAKTDLLIFVQGIKTEKHSILLRLGEKAWNFAKRWQKGLEQHGQYNIID